MGKFVLNALTDDLSQHTKDVHRSEPLLEQHDQVFSEMYTTEIDVPDGGYGWVVVAGAFFCAAVVDGTLNSFGIYMSELVKEFGETEGRVAWVGSISPGFAMLSGPLASILTNKYGCRITCIIGCILSSTSLTAAIFCPTITWLMVVYAFVGIGLGFIIFAAVVIVGYYFETKRALATAITLTGSGFGTCVYPPIMNYIVMEKSWRVANLTQVAIVLVTLLPAFLMKPLKKKTVVHHNEVRLTSHVPDLMKNEQSNLTVDISLSNQEEQLLYKQKSESPKKENTSSSRNRSVSNVEYFASEQMKIRTFSKRDMFSSGSGSGLNVDFLKTVDNSLQNEKWHLKVLFDVGVLKNPKFMLFAITNIFPMISYYIPFIFLVELAKTNDIEATQAAFLLSVIGIVYTISLTSFGLILRFPKVDALFVQNICYLIGMVSLVGIPFCVSYTSYIFVITLFGIAIAAYITFGPIIVAEILGLEQFSSGIGILQLCRGLAIFVGCPISGAIVDVSHSFKIAFFVGGGFFLIATILGFTLQLLRRERKKLLTSNLMF